MATQEDVRRIALALPGVAEGTERFEFSVLNRGKWKGLAWIWSERVEPKKPRIPRPNVVAIRVGGEEAKDFLLHAAPEVFFTEPHYNGFPAILVRLDKIAVEQLEGLLIDAWHIQAPKALIREYAAQATQPET